LPKANTKYILPLTQAGLLSIKYIARGLKENTNTFYRGGAEAQGIHLCASASPR